MPIFLFFIIAGICLYAYAIHKASSEPRNTRKNIRKADDYQYSFNQVQSESINHSIEMFFYCKKNLLSIPEQSFYSAIMPLCEARGLTIFTKVGLKEFISIQLPKHKSKEYMKYFNKISCKHVDFVLCKHSMPVLAIELDDLSHLSDKAKDKDVFKDALFRQIQLPLIRILGNYRKGDLEQLLFSGFPEENDSVLG